MQSIRIAAAALVCAFGALSAAPCVASTHKPAANALLVDKKLGPAPAGVVELKFEELFKRPVGDRGLEPSEKLAALDGKRVRIVGYMVQQPTVPLGSFLLAPLPTSISDEDEPMADDLPPSTIGVVLPASSKKPVPALHGLVQVTGVLHVGAFVDAPSDRVCAVQITLDARWAHKLLDHPVSTAQDHPAAKTSH